ncbi:MAG: hypothetical protein AAFZ65_17360 [Planctomycetota bacterium]
MKPPPPTPSQRPVGTWELDDFYRSLRDCVLTLERAWERGELARVLEREAERPDWHPPVVASYRRMLRRSELQPVPYRESAIRTLLEQARRELFETPCLFEAQVANFDRSTRGQQPGVLEQRAHGRIDAIAARSPRGEVLLRMDQVIAVRFWGIGFTLEDPTVSDTLTTAVAHEVVNQLAYALLGIEKIQRRLLGRELSDDLQVIPPAEGHRFEQLILDVLNEHYACGRHAPLYEDFFEKTDLRLHVRGLVRRRGARAQITRIVDAAQHAAKLEQIHNLDEFVILSPRSLAIAVQNPDEIGLSREDVALFWQLFPTQPTDDDELAAAIRNLLLAAIERPTAGPRGPMTAVPEPLRLLIQAFARADAQRATRRMRQRLADHKGD